MVPLDQIKKRQKKEQEIRRAKEREEQRQEEMRERKLKEARELERSLMKRDEALRSNMKLKETESKAKQKAAVYHDRRRAEKQAENAHAKRTIVYKQSISQSKRSIARSGEKEQALKEQLHQNLLENRKTEKHDAEMSGDRKDKLVAAKKLEVRSAAKEAQVREYRLREILAARTHKEDEAGKSKDLKERLAEAKRLEVRSAAKNAQAQEHRRKQILESRVIRDDEAWKSNDLKDRIAEAKKLKGRSASKNAQLKEYRRREILESRRLKEDSILNSRERRSAIVKARREDERSSKRQAIGQESRLGEKRRVGRRKAAARTQEKQKTARGRLLIAHKESHRQGARSQSSDLMGLIRSVQSAQRIPSGILSSSLPWLSVNGRYIVDELNCPVSLRGVSIGRLERDYEEGSLYVQPLDDIELAAFQRWGMSALAITIDQDLIFEGLGETGPEDYLSAIDECVQSAAEEGIYIVLRLSSLSSHHSSDSWLEGGSTSLALPDDGSIELWSSLARRYSCEPAVIFDFFRNPDKPDDANPGLFGLKQLFWPAWKHRLMMMIGVIRREHPRAMIIARGPVDDLSGFPLSYSDGSSVNNIVYATKISQSTMQQGIAEVTRLTKSGYACLLDIEADSQGERQVESQCTVLARNGIHWISSEWMGNAAPLVVRGRLQLEPTPLGRAFQRAMNMPTSPDFNFESDVKRGCMLGTLGGARSRLDALCKGCIQAEENLEIDP